MLSKTLIVCLLALFCLQLTLASDRLNVRIASPFTSTPGQFPYIAFLQYRYPDPSNATNSLIFSATGIIYSATSVVTTANVFNSYPATGGNLTVSVGAFDVTSAVQVFNFAATVGQYALVPNGTTPPTPPPTQILIPTTFVKGSSQGDIAVVKLPPGNSFDLTNPEIKIANFPTSSPIPSETIYAVAYGNQAPSGPTFPQLKFAQIFLKRNNLCTSALSSAGVTRPFSFATNFCVQSKLPANTNGTFNGVCANDIGGAIVRDGDITNPSNYYEVVGLVSYAGDATTCNPTAPVPAVAVYLWAYTSNFIVPLLGSLSSVGNGRNPANNPNSAKGNFICGNNVVEGPYEKCEGSSNPCCNPNTCAFKFPTFFCGTGAKNATAPNKCLTRLICDNSGTCATRSKGVNKPCGKGKICDSNHNCVSKTRR